ncbi:hypothetical protein CHUAL_002198 [Chamberlinius hualienensis]
MALPVFYNADKWIKANQNDFVPPVCTKAMHDGQLKVVYVGGPNFREDFHIEEGEEFFYMVKGDMKIIINQQGKFHEIPIKEGQVFLLPARVAHSPQRSADTIGLLIERERKPSELDGVRWFVKGSSEILYERWCHMTNLTTSIASVIKEFFGTKEFKTGRPDPNGKPTPQEKLNNNPVPAPFYLQQWLTEHIEEIKKRGYKKLFDTDQTEVTIYGPGHHDSYTDLYENFVWQLGGERQFTIGGKHYDLQSNDTLLIPADVSFASAGSNNCLTFVAKMKPKTS